MNPFITLLIIFCCLTFSSQAGNGIIHLTDSNYAVIPYTESHSYLFKKAKPTTLTKEEIQEIETMANKSIDEYNKTTKWQKIDRQYKVQLVAVINKKGEKEIWINCFCHPLSRWREEIVGMRDGGSCYFQLKINLSTKKGSGLKVGETFKIAFILES